MAWVDVKKEMTDEKGLDAGVADRIGEYVKHKGMFLPVTGTINSLVMIYRIGGPSLLEQLTADTTLMANSNAKQGLADMGLLFSLLKAYNVLDRVGSVTFKCMDFIDLYVKISFDLSLARGLDYYTGIIYEAVVEASAPPGFKTANALALPSDTPTPAAPTPKKKSKKPASDENDEEDVDESQVGVGSIAAGGRYDGLVSMFLSAAGSDGKKEKAVAQVPCVGVSIGLDRIFAIVWPRWVEKGMRSKETMVYVMSAGDGLLQERVELVTELRTAGIKVRTLRISEGETFFILQ